uniref:Odorant receptor n=1 Tax=Histia rhodope TaxID=1453155 RepID=A0A7G4KBT2_9NEOP|nr:odorant receptor [Histia rhodope]
MGLTKIQQENKYHSIIMFVYICGLPHFWYKDVDWSPRKKNLLKFASKFINHIGNLFFITELLAYFTQKELDEQQFSFWFGCAFTHTMCISAIFSLVYHKKNIESLITRMIVTIPNIHHDEEVSEKMIKKCFLYVLTSISTLNLTVLFHGVKASKEYMNGGIFLPVITFWPKTSDLSTAATIGRFVAYIMWWIWVARVSGILTTAIILTICSSHLFNHLQTYFKKMSTIFEENLTIDQKQQKYEASMKVAFKMHHDILNHIEVLIDVCNVTYGGQILMNVSILTIMMFQLASLEHFSIVEILPHIMIMITVLTVTACYMWSLGDVTIESAELSNAIYMSGWENCQNDYSIKMRRLVMIAMTQTQKPLETKTLGLIPVSHESYVSIVKASYSIFSLIFYNNT